MDLIKSDKNYKLSIKLESANLKYKDLMSKNPLFPLFSNNANAIYTTDVVFPKDTKKRRIYKEISICMPKRRLYNYPQQGPRN